MWKQIVSDCIHCTQMEFMLKHPLFMFVFFGAFVIGYLIIWYFQDKKKK